MTGEEQAAAYLAKRRADLPRNDAGDCVCPSCSRVIPFDTWECDPCETVRREAERIRKAKEAIRDGFLTCANRTDGYGNYYRAPTWAYANFDNETFRDLVSADFLVAVESWDPAKGNLVLCGDSGLGKTSLLVAWLRCRLAQAEEALSKSLVPNFAFLTGLDLVAARRTHKLGTAESKIIECAKTVPLLFLDEVGFEDLRDQLVLEVTDARYRAEVVTVMTTGQTPVGWADRYGAAAWRRLTERGNVVCDFRDGALKAVSG